MTGIRGIAAVWVMMLHAQIRAVSVFDMPILDRIKFLGSGWRGVDLFFMLSGFILMYAHGREFQHIRKGSLIRFARLRFTRVYPVNAVVALLIGIVVLAQPGFVAWAQATHNPGDYTPVAFFQTMFLANRWFLPGDGDWNGPVWSLSLEVLGYMAFPFLAFCALRVKARWKFIGVSFLLLVGSDVILRATHNPQWTIRQFAIVRMIACFVTGIAIFRLWTLSAETSKRWAGWIAAISAAGILIMGSLNVAGIAINFFFATLLYGLAFQHGIVNAVLASRVAVFFGEISFPLYLTHVVPLLWLWYYIPLHATEFTHLQKALFMVCWIVGCIVVATLLHYFVEKPFHAMGRRWAGERVVQ
jgi:peptidoglycan/LPS O-acetylase OafA/YrhL